MARSRDQGRGRAGCLGVSALAWAEPSASIRGDLVVPWCGSWFHCGSSSASVPRWVPFFRTD